MDLLFSFFNFTTGNTKILKAEMKNFLHFTTINSFQWDTILQMCV